MLVCCHPTVFINWGWLIGEKFVLPDRPMYFAVGAMFFLLISRPQPLDRFKFFFFFFLLQAKMEKFFL